ncbi:hypothetical protein C8R47DRAFT_288880 [Mycena vitilis]|nr:hypothetical protein C8R47DRAFT_288880 [Mycena vitilis]
MPLASYAGATIHAGVVNISSGDIVTIGGTSTTNFHVSERQSCSKSGMGPAVPSRLPSCDSLLPDYRTIRAGDVHLLAQVGEDQTIEADEPDLRTGIVTRRVLIGKRKVFRARIFGSSEPMTAIVYEGSRFQKWRTEVERMHAQIPRNPLFLQLFGVTVSANMKALIYHDALVPVECFKGRYLELPLTIAYIENQLGTEWDYAHTVLPDFVSTTHCSPWVTSSTGHLCIHPDGGSEDWPALRYFPNSMSHDLSLPKIPILPGATDTENQLRSILTLRDIHRLIQLARMYISDWVPLHGDVQLGVVKMDCRIDLGLCVCLASFQTTVTPVFVSRPWWAAYPNFNDPFPMLHNGWTRVSVDALSGTPGGSLWFNIKVNPSLVGLYEQMWLSQANWCFERFLRPAVEGVLDERFFLCHSVAVQIGIESDHEPLKLPKLPYLFLDRLTGELVDGKFFARIPPLRELFYWSFDLDGGRRLDDSAAELLRLPRVSSWIWTGGSSWTASQYRAIREVHKAKGFDPDSSDVAISLGYPLLTPHDKSRFAEWAENDTQCVLV